MKLIVCGGSKRDLGYAVRAELDALHASRPISLIIEGGDLGAGRVARGWAIEHKIPYRTEEADYDTYGANAWPVRNHDMLQLADAVLVFPGGMGTRDMVEQARQARVTVYEPF